MTVLPNDVELPEDRTESATTDATASESMVWRVYGVVPADSSIPDLPDDAGGLRQRHFEVLTHGGVAAVVEPVDVDQKARRKDLLAHSELLNALAADGPVIPVAFGSAFEDKAHVVHELLGPQEVALSSMLDQLRGHAEFVLRVRYSMDDLLAEVVEGDAEIAALREQTRDLPEPDGHSLRIRLGELVSHAVEARQAVDTDWLLGQLQPVVADLQVSSRSTTEGTINLAFLVHTSRRQAFEAAAEACADSIGGRARLELLGPMAAFDFVPEG